MPSLALVAALVVIAVVAVVSSANSRGGADRRLTETSRVMAIAAVTERHLVDLETGLRGDLATGNRAFLAPWTAARKALPSEFAGLVGLTGGQLGQERAVVALRRAVEGYEIGYATPLLRTSQALGRARLDGLFGAGKHLMDALRARFARFDGVELGLERAEERRLAGAERRFTTFVVGAVSALLLALLGVLLYLRGVVVAPLRRAIAACAAIAAGEPAVKVPVAGAPEVRELAGAFNTMLGELHGRQAAVQASERRYHSIAANVPGMVFRFAMSPDGEFSLPFASAGAREIYGLEPEQLIADARITINSVLPDDRAGFLKSVAVSAEQLTRWEWRGRGTSANGTVKYLHATAHPTREPDGTVLWDGVLLDETEIHHARRREAEAQQRLQLILDNLAGSAVVLYDRELRLRFCEGPLFAHLDMREMLGRPLPEFVDEPTMRLLSPGIGAALHGEISTAVLDSDDEGRTLAIQFAPYRVADDVIDGALVHWRDISAVRTAERERDEALELFQVAFDRAPIGIVVVGLDGRFQRVNDALCQITGYAHHDLLAMAPFAIVHAEDLDQVQQQFAQLGAVHDSMTFEHQIAHAAGHPVWVQARVTLIRDGHDRPVHVLAQIQDIAERRTYEDRLRHMADHDPVTGLLNRRGFEAALESHLAHCRRYGATGALLMLDLDGFKSVNDTLGHAAGDELIITTAHALTDRLRETDTVARLGGDEFAVLLPTQTEAEAKAVAEALLATIRKRATLMSHAHLGRVTASIGVATFSDATPTADEMLVNADRAMYDAKQAGKDRYALNSRDGYPISAT